VKAAEVNGNSRGIIMGAQVVKKSNEIHLITSFCGLTRTLTKVVREAARDTKGNKIIFLSHFEISVVTSLK
jgi:DNA gyrase/topoisomerase IV subunit A